LFSFQRTSSRYFLKAATKTILPHIIYAMQPLFLKKFCLFLSRNM
jgi:hypothetical protein